MNIHNHCSMKRTVIPFLLLSLLMSVMIGCGGNKNAVDEVVVRYQDPGESVFPASDYFQLENKLDINDQGDYFLSDVSGVFLTDDYAFLLDSRQAISKVDLKTGEIVKQLYQVGNGPQDYLRAVNITGDKEHLYLLDHMTKRVHVYDFDLKHQDRFDVEYIPSPSSFVKLKDGFLFLNSAEDTKLGAFVVTDNRGVKKASFLELKEEPVYNDDEMAFRVVYTDNCFFTNADGNMLCYYPNANEIYLYDGKTLSKQFSIKPDDNLVGTRGVNIRKVFYMNGKTLVGYMCDYKPSFGWFDKDGNLLAKGHGQYITLRFQIYQSGDKVVLVLMAQDLLETEAAGKSVQAQISFYRPK